jgi:hypothetical protein
VCLAHNRLVQLPKLILGTLGVVQARKAGIASVGAMLSAFCQSALIRARKSNDPKKAGGAAQSSCWSGHHGASAHGHPLMEA